MKKNVSPKMKKIAVIVIEKKLNIKRYDFFELFSNS